MAVIKSLNDITFKEDLPLAFLLHGDDTIGLSKAREQLLENLFSWYNDFQEEYFDSSVEDIDGFLSRIMTPTLFGEFRLFHINHLQKLSNNEIKSIASVLQYPIDNVLILLEYAKDTKKKIGTLLDAKKLVKSGQLCNLTYKKPRQYEMSSWLVTQVKTLFNRKITADAAEQLLNFAGYELDRIYSELQKLDIYLPDKGVITPEAIEIVTGSSKVVKPDELSNALGYRKWKEASESIGYLLNSANRYSIFQLLNALFRHFWNLYKIRLYAEENRASANRYFKTSYKEKNQIAGDIAIAAGVIAESQRNRVYPAIVIPGIIDQAVKYSKEELQAVLCSISSFDRKLKSGKEKQDVATFTHFCFSIVREGRSVS